MTNFLTARLWSSLLALAIFAISARAADVFPVLQTKTDSYQNVTVVSRTATHLFIQHSRGVADIKIADLNGADLQSLGIVPAVQTAPAKLVEGERSETPPPGTVSAKPKSMDLAAFLKSLMPAQGSPGIEFFSLVMKFLAVFLIALLCLYLARCYCIKLICEKSGHKPGIMAWLPILQDIALIRAAGMSAFWYVAFILPNLVLRLAKDWFLGWQFVLLGVGLLALVAHVLWCIRICRARGKGTLAMILLVLPFTYPFAFIYLAFSSGSAPDVETTSPLGKPLETEPLPA